MRSQICKLSALVLCVSLLLGTAARAAEPEPVTRGGFVQALYEAHLTYFEETPAGGDAAAWAKEAGIVKGFADGQLRLEEPITRAQAAVMLYRYAGTLTEQEPAPQESALDGYEDGAEVPAWCRNEVSWTVVWDMWFSGSSSRLGAGETLTAAECEMLVQAVHQAGMPLEEDWENSNTSSIVTLKLESASTDGAVLRMENRGEEPLVYGADYGLYRMINGGWYMLNSNMAVIAIAYTMEPGGSTELKTYGQLSPGEYRFAKHVTVGAESCLLTVDFTV